MRLAAALLSLAACLAAQSGLAQGAKPSLTRPPAMQEDATLRAVVASPQRSAENRARDPHRRPYESLAFWGLRPGLTVVELSPGGGYWTEILAPYARQTRGTYIAGLGGDPAKFKARYADEAMYGPVQIVPFGKDAGPLAPAGSADLVLTARNIHNFMGQGTLDKIMADAFAALKPGGYLAVEEHRADPRPMLPDASDGYVSEAHVIAAASKAGFRLDARSNLNANPKDTKDHPFGVWTLAPNRRTASQGQPANPSFDRARFDAIGESDRMMLRFVKPT